MRKLVPLLLALLFLCGCSYSAIHDSTASNAAADPEVEERPTASFQPSESTRVTEAVMGIEPVSQEQAAEEQTEAPALDDSDKEERIVQMMINDIPVHVQWENNESVTALMTLVQEAPLTITMSPYGGFEQVGPIDPSLPRNDVQTVTESGDIVLYSGNQLVVFYGSNTWAYTRLGHITDKTPSELAELLGSGSVTITISWENKA